MNSILHVFAHSAHANNMVANMQATIDRVASKYPDSKVHEAYIGPTWGRQDPGGPHFGPMNLAVMDHTRARFTIKTVFPYVEGFPS